MYICSCRALTDRDINKAINKGASHPKAVYEMCGFKPDCGKCVIKIANMLKDYKQEQSNP